jgi:cytochrome c-type biogenesis protein CcmH/NrfG
MATSLESSGSPATEGEAKQPARWFKVGAVAAVSAIAGGLLAALWYRQTIHKLHQAEQEAQNPHFGIPPDDPADEI